MKKNYKTYLGVFVLLTTNFIKRQTSRDLLSNVNKLEKNHIYFYNYITTKNCLKLNKEINIAAKYLMSNPENFREQDKYIYIHINSYGGDILSALSTVDTIINCPIPVVSIIEGGAASAATLLSIVADYRMITSNGFMLIHELRSGMWGKLEYLEDKMMNLDLFMTTIKDIYKKNSKLNNRELDLILKRDIWWDAEKCLKEGLIDEIIENKKLYKINKKNINL
ncbi:Clp protease [seawater metagenome]|uniref:Clp protease n=1 Tax=seawater metagenome TaxID=1561972 RepID=A0A5E8CIB4_9ZZZZ